MKRPKLKKRIELAAGRLAMTTLFRLSKHLNPARVERWGKILGGFIFKASRRYRRVALKNLTAAYPEWNEQDVKKTARESFTHFGRGALEFFYFLSVPSEELDERVEIEGKEHLDAALANGHGAIIVTAHLGNWELFARIFVLLGYPISVIARDSDDPTITEITNTIRQNAGYKVLGRDKSALPALRALRRNEVLGILPDQNTLSGIFVDFFGRPVATATGPAVFAIRSGAPIICGYTKRLGGGRFKTVLYPPIDLPLTGNEEADIHNVTAALTRAIEEEIRKEPAQWLWLHDRWRRTTEAPNTTGSVDN